MSTPLDHLRGVHSQQTPNIAHVGRHRRCVTSESRNLGITHRDVVGADAYPLRSRIGARTSDATTAAAARRGVIPVATVSRSASRPPGSARCWASTADQSKDHVFWTHFPRGLVKRGLNGIELVTSDAHEGLRAAVAKVLSEACWQRCRVHFMRNLLSLIPRRARAGGDVGAPRLRRARSRVEIQGRTPPGSSDLAPGPPRALYSGQGGRGECPAQCPERNKDTFAHLASRRVGVRQLHCLSIGVAWRVPYLVHLR